MLTTPKVAKILLTGLVVLISSGYGSIGAAEVLNSSKFVTVDADHQTMGTVEILRKENRIYVRLADDFSTAEGPDLHLLLHEKNPPIGYDKGDYVSLGRLKSFNGAQVYMVPDDVALDRYISVVVWCRKFNIVFGTAHLEGLAETIDVVGPGPALSHSRQPN